jgi:hypothetical protein
VEDEVEEVDAFRGELRQFLERLERKNDQKGEEEEEEEATSTEN